MLAKLRNSLVVFNSTILIVFVVCVVLSIWFVVTRGQLHFVDKGLKDFSMQVRDLHTLPDPPPHYIDDDEADEMGSSRDDFVKVILRDHTLTATAVSPGGGKIEAQTREMARKAWNKKTERWDTIDRQGQYIRVYSMPFNKNGEQGMVQISVNLSMQRYFMNKFFGFLLVIGLVFAIVAAFIAWVLAGRALIPVKKAWSRQEQFVADASHELRTPLTVIQTNLDVVLAASPGDTVADHSRWLENAYTETRHMGKLISELLFLAQIDARQAVLARTVFDFSALLDEIREKMEPVAESRELGFSCHFEPGMTLRGDYDRIRQLLLILLDNAFKYTPARGMVRLSARKSRGKLEVMVEDSGIGICPEEKDRIFDRFYRVDKVRSRSQGGTGLGLSIARWIADAHHGTILVESEPGHGSRFIINLPVE